VPEGLLGSLIAELFVDAIVDTVLWGTGALVLKMIRPHRPVNQIAAIAVGLIIWLVGIAALFTIGYFLLV
jgi:hypothetical protein